MDRRQFTGMLVSAAATAVGVAVSARTAQSKTPSLSDTLEKGLKARLPSEFKFIALVVKMVGNGTLPESLVLSVFHYVRKKIRNKRGLVPYFEEALRLAAARVGIKIP
ncbi:MAG: hypothetical protein ABGX07_12615 [Pirellulaceae bacterium]